MLSYAWEKVNGLPLPLPVYKLSSLYPECRYNRYTGKAKRGHDADNDQIQILPEDRNI